DIKSIGGIGGRTLLVFVLLLTGMAIVMIPIASAVMAALPPNAGARNLPAGAADAARELATGGQTQTFAAWITSLLPSNPVAAAATGAMMPLILFTLLLALAIASSPAA